MATEQAKKADNYGPHLRVALGTIKHADQRYPTVGDWYEEKGQLVIKTSQLADWRYEALIALHEFVEAILCRQQGIAEADVLAFDLAFEAKRPVGNEAEPGDDKNAPYRRQHQFATIIERAVAQELGVNWRAYERALSALEEAPDAVQHPQGGEQVLRVREEDRPEAGLPSESSRGAVADQRGRDPEARSAASS